MTLRQAPSRWLTALPVYNEAKYVTEILDQVTKHAADVLVVDDGSTDGTDHILSKRNDVTVLRHEKNKGYGAALISAFDFTVENEFAGVVTIDCDGQHQPAMIPAFIDAASKTDIVSGSRYLDPLDADDAPPPERMFINRRITAELNQRLGYELTDAFCGFKAYNVAALKRLQITDTGYAMPLQVWVEAAAAGLDVMELAVPLIYLDLERSFGGSLDHAETRLKYYHQVLDQAFAKVAADGIDFPARPSEMKIGKTG